MEPFGFFSILHQTRNLLSQQSQWQLTLQNADVRMKEDLIKGYTIPSYDSTDPKNETCMYHKRAQSTFIRASANSTIITTFKSKN